MPKKKWTKRHQTLANKWYSKGHAVGLMNGEARGVRTVIEDSATQLKVKDDELKRQKVEAMIKLANAASQALSAIAGILDNSRGVLQ